MSETLTPSRDEFAEMFEASIVDRDTFEQTVVKGTVTAIEKDVAIIDVGLKTEGRVPLKEFYQPGAEEPIKIGSTVDVFIDRVENAQGEAVISREKARREEAWDRLERSFEDEDRVEGHIFNRVKGGFTVDLGGAVAFLPGSQVDIRPVRDATPLMNLPQPFKILKMDKRRGNIVVSRRAVLEEDRAEHRQEVVRDLNEGDEKEGVVKNITDYGAFVELAPGVDGLLHVTDMSWSRVNHPSEVLNVNDTVRVKIIKINPETSRISLGMKQLQPDPWEGVSAKYPVSGVFHGKVTNITDYGAFVELEDGIEGLVHVSEMSWVKKNVPPSSIVSPGQEVDVMVLEVDEYKRRISLGLKQTLSNPWETFAERHPIGSTIEGEVKNITEFGLFVGIEDDMDGMVHLSDLDWDRSGDDAIKDYRKGDVVQAKILDVDPDKERISLGIKQVANDPMESMGELQRGADVTCEVTAIENGGIEVRVGGDGGPKAFIRKSDLSRDRNEQRPERFAVGDKIDARITAVDRASRRLSLSIKARELAEEKKAVEEFGSADSGASLGDILGAALKDTPDA
ncbi:30S ribosomal protein S1 [Parvularcula dongshanensis]|uniref:30S ribosomal protein S1 n=1 Tax=Parvularcula dongshanensis TaxID=1173995 RepID=A0A840I0Q3_9PROT|nr:30S ribosomal protein S1 [Parvularcula dongshanensis]MBB4657915.1 small subunit ribosomal protein S1 [Parvularcula dongshanensis]